MEQTVLSTRAFKRGFAEMNMTSSTSELERHIYIHRSFILRDSSPVHLQQSQYLKNQPNKQKTLKQVFFVVVCIFVCFTVKQNLHAQIQLVGIFLCQKKHSHSGDEDTVQQPCIQLIVNESIRVPLQTLRALPVHVNNKVK